MDVSYFHPAIKFLLKAYRNVIPKPTISETEEIKRDFYRKSKEEVRKVREDMQRKNEEIERMKTELILSYEHNTYPSEISRTSSR